MKRIIQIILLLGMLVMPLLATAQSPSDRLTALPALPAATPLTAASDTFPADKNGRVRVIIELKGAPLGTQQGQTRRTAALAKQQQAVASALLTAAPSAQIGQQYQTLFNGLSVSVDAADTAALAALPNVQAIHPDTRLVPLTDASLDLIDADFMWNALGGQDEAGEGIKVAIIDSGIDPDHPMFADDNYIMPSGYPKGYCATTAGFCNDKVIAARWYGDNGNIPSGAHTSETATPFDFIGTGSHVAGIAAGNGNVTADSGNGLTSTLSGVAPRAYVMAYKICWLGADCLASNVIKAVEDAVADGAHVINISLGSGAGNTPSSSATAPFTTAIRNAVADGVPVVVPAGDAGSTAGSIICPGCVEEAITVGSVSTGRVHALPVTVTGPSGVSIGSALVDIPAFSGDGTAITADISGDLVDAADADSGNEDGCTVFPAGSLVNDIVLLERGGCTFSQKLSNAQVAGAKAAIVFDNALGQLFVPEVGNATLPMVLISQADGLALREHIDDAAGVTAATSTVEIGYQLIASTRAEWRNWVLASSSRGPNGDQSYLKPDVVAPGSYVIAPDTAANGGTGYQMRTGSGTAAPFVTGAIALLRQLHPTWTPGQIKAAVMAQANINGLVIEDGTTLGNPFDRGAGRLDLDRMTANPALFDAPSWVETTCTDTCTWTTVLENITDQTLTYSSIIKNASGLTWSVSPGAVQLTAGQTQTVTVTVDASSATVSEWVFADLVWTSSDSSLAESSLPMAVYALGDDVSKFEKKVTPNVAAPGEIVRWDFVVRNNGTTTQTVMITDTLPAGVTYESGSVTAPFNYINDAFTAAFVTEPQFVFTEDSFRPYQSLTTVDPTLQPLVCPNKCDDEYMMQPGLAFTYLGKQYDTVYINTNGYVTLETPTGTMNFPQQMPNAAMPDGIIAPLWSDYDLQGDANDTAGGGEIYVMPVATASNPDGWVVIEWKNAQHWLNPNDTSAPLMTVSFQLWIETNGDQFWFAYGDLTNEDAYRTAVGAESDDGLEGAMYWFTDGTTETGTSPADNEMVRFESNLYRMSFETMVDAQDDTEIVNVATMTADGVTVTASETLSVTKAIPTMIVLNDAPTAVVTPLTLVLIVLALALVTLIAAVVKYGRA